MKTCVTPIPVEGETAAVRYPPARFRVAEAAVQGPGAVPQILAEWSRIGQTRVVNGDKVPGGPLTLQFVDMPEA